MGSKVAAVRRESSVACDGRISEIEQQCEARLTEQSTQCEARLTAQSTQFDVRLTEQSDQLSSVWHEERDKLVSVWNEKLIDQRRKMDERWGEKLAEAITSGKSLSAQLTSELESLQTQHSEHSKEVEVIRKKLKHAEECLAEAEAKASDVRQLQDRLRALETENGVFREELDSAQDSEGVWHRFAQDRISYQQFEIGNIALFMKNESGHYEAFNAHLPHRFLSHESKQIIFNDGRTEEEVPFILGRIVLITERKATEDANPYGLEAGADFWELLVETVGDR